MITAQDLIKHKANQHGVDYIQRFYPEGAEIADLLKDKHISKEFLHWTRLSFPYTEEEKTMYEVRMNIIGSENLFYSDEVFNSSFIVSSNKIENSSYVFSSTDIKNCRNVVSSESVEDGEQIFSCFMVSNSSGVIEGSNIINSKNICCATAVIESSNIIESTNVYNSSEICNSRDITESYFCKNSRNLKNCMFCNGLTDAEFYIFNQPVDEVRFGIFKQQYLKYMDVALKFVKEWPDDLAVSTKPAISRRFDEWYKPIPDIFWKWVRTLPGYDAMMLYEITMREELLKEI